ncbi:MAG TPA: RnfABCDGE type electron transport complex subunit D [Nitriliruptorales bacterium]|nr:RnfABCDGE type electron transport complex subunit D [Nitriliruptorales bacterium]
MSVPAPTTALADRPHLSVGGRRIPVILPTRRDPRLHLAIVLLTVQVLGQTVLDFKLSVAQILVSIATAAAIELAVTLRRDGVVLWPASAMLTGNSVALLLRATGTEHGDWWSLNGIGYFIAAVVLGMASKYLIRPAGRHVFNPSNVGLVWVLLVVGPAGVFPQYLWWGPLGLPVGAALVVIVAGAVWILRRVRMAAMAAAFTATFAVSIGVFAAAGRSFWAIWHPVPVAGAFYWVNVVLSPEVLIFVFFMMSDPATAPRTPRGRLAFGVLTALLAAALVYPQSTEFGVKLAILSSLTVTCALAALIDRAAGRAEHARPGVPVSADPRAVLGRIASTVRRPAVVAAMIIAVAAPLDTLSLADDEHLILIERGLSGDPNPQ